jgi:hypothetical protein
MTVVPTAAAVAREPVALATTSKLSSPADMAVSVPFAVQLAPVARAVVQWFSENVTVPDDKPDTVKNGMPGVCSVGFVNVSTISRVSFACSTKFDGETVNINATGAFGSSTNASIAPSTFVDGVDPQDATSTKALID